MGSDRYAVFESVLVAAALSRPVVDTALAVLLVVAAVVPAGIYLRRSRRRARLDIRFLRMELLVDGRLVSTLAAPSRSWGEEFRFVVRGDKGTLRLDYPRQGEPAIAVRRGGGPGEFNVIMASGDKVTLLADDAGIDLGAGMRAVVTDRRAWRPPAASASLGSSARVGGESAEVRRYLRCRCPEIVAPGQVVSLIASVGVSWSKATGQSATLLKRFDVPEGGVKVLLVADAPGMQRLGQDRQVVVVPGSGDSEPVLFEFVADQAGRRQVSLTAWQDGSYLGELRALITVRSDAPDRPAREFQGEIDAAHMPGEVTLVVRRDGLRYRFEFRDIDFPPEIQAEMAYDPGPKVIRLLDDLASGASGYSPKIARRQILNAGLELWEELVPDRLKQQFWERRHRISQLTILSDTGTVPWELLYTKDSGQDEGFLAQQFPLTRAVFGQVPHKDLRLIPARFVVPDGSPPGAHEEVAALRAILEPGQAGAPVITKISPLLDLISQGDFSVLHFACHNRFDQASGSAILMDAPFTPLFLTDPGSDRTLGTTAPLVFINACTTAGQAPSYNRLDGWASKFLNAGAGAFIGTQWTVRDDSACEFATSLYTNLKQGLTLGESGMKARQEIAENSTGDPTWLAYAIYGHAQAQAQTTASLHDPWL